MARWRDGNGMNSFYPAAARVGYSPETILKEMRDMIEAIGDANGFTSGNVHGVENCSIVPCTINEMLCTGHGGVFRVFPAWPKDRGARFRNTRVWGALLVSGKLKGGQVQQVTVHSEKGRDCTLVNPWAGRAIEVVRDGQKAETLQGDRVVVKNQPGRTLVLRPQRSR